MTQRSKPEVRFGKNARMYVAAYTPNGEEPAFDQYRYFCATDQIELGGEKGTEAVQNFCTGGNEVAMDDGTETPTLTVGDATWTEKDAALAIFKAAYKNKDAETNYVWYRVYPLGLGEGKPVFRGLLQVGSWKLTIPSKGFIKMANGLNPVGVPEEGTAGANNAFIPEDETETLTGAALTDNTAANLPALQASQSVDYSVTTAAAGDLTAVVSGGTGTRTVTIKDSAGTVRAGPTQDSATYAAAPAGTYTVTVTGTTAVSGAQILADWATV